MYRQDSKHFNTTTGEVNEQLPFKLCTIFEPTAIAKHVPIQRNVKKSKISQLHDFSNNALL